MASQPPPEWKWDTPRQAWYYYHPSQNCYIYEDGTKIRLDGTPLPETPRTPGVSLGSIQGARRPSNTSNPDNAYTTRRPALTETLSSPAAISTNSSSVLGSTSQRQTYQPNTQGNTRQPSSTKERRIRGTHGTEEPLDKEFKVRYPGFKFFKEGVVFKILWSEPWGDLNSRNSSFATEILTPNYVEGKHGEKINCEIRWFVVVKEGHDCCTCLRIQTFNRRGVGAGKVKSHYAIIYTGDIAPNPLPNEVPGPGENPMGDPIRVKPVVKRGNTMNPISRVNFHKQYTVEHNVKVYEFGYVDPSDHWSLIGQWKRALDTSSARPSHRAIRGYSTSSGVTTDLARTTRASGQSGAPATLSSVTSDFQNLGVAVSSIPGTGYGGYGRPLNPAAPDYRNVSQDPTPREGTGSDQYRPPVVPPGSGYPTRPGYSAPGGTARTPGSEYDTGHGQYGNPAVSSGRGYSINPGYSGSGGSARILDSESTARHGSYYSSRVSTEHDRPRRSSNSTSAASGENYDHPGSRHTVMPQSNEYDEDPVVSGDETEVPDYDELYAAPTYRGRRH